MTFVEIYVFLSALGPVANVWEATCNASPVGIQGKKVYRSGFHDIHFGWHLEFLAFMGIIV